MPLFNIKKSTDQTKPIPQETKEDVKETGNIYTNLFEQPVKPSKNGLKSDILTGVFKKEEKAKSKSNVLGPLPELQSKIVGAFDPSKRKLNFIRNGFFALVAISLLIIGFFYIELDPKFDLLFSIRGQNTAQKLNNTQKDIVALQTSINQKNYLLLNYYLQELSYLSDTYASARNKALPTNELSDLQNKILLAYENAQSKWKEPIVAGSIPEATFTDELKKNLQSELANLRKEQQTPDIAIQIASYESTIRLVGNMKLNTFFSKNVDEIKANLPQDDSLLFALTTSTLNILKNNFSTISELKAQRVQWSQIVNEIDKITKSVDTLYNTGFFDELGGIQYSAYDFDASSNKIILTGKTKRDDGTTFTLIANLLDALEKSALFSNVDDRTYPKSGSPEEGYNSTFRIELSLEGGTLESNPA